MPEPTYSDSSCSGSRPLYLGGARGRRVFYLDEHGTLRGVTYRYPWRDGENVAECLVTKKPNVMAPNARSSLWVPHPPYVVGGVTFSDDPTAPPELTPNYEWDKCEGLDPDCACGFYAYHSGETMYALSGPGCRVTAVVEAYGRLVLGTLGYRAEKARILGVVKPPETEATRRRQQLSAHLSDLKEALAQVERSPGALLGRTPRRMAAIAALSAVATAVVPARVTPAFLLLTGLLVTNAYLFARALRAEYKATVEALGESIDTVQGHINMLPDDYSEFVEKAMARYPSVQWFDSLAELAEAFPCESLKELAMGERNE